MQSRLQDVTRIGIGEKIRWNQQENDDWTAYIKVDFKCVYINLNVWRDDDPRTMKFLIDTRPFLYHTLSFFFFLLHFTTNFTL